MYTLEELGEHPITMELRKLPRKVWTEAEADEYWMLLAEVWDATLEEYKAKFVPGHYLTNPLDPSHHAINLTTGEPNPDMFLMYPQTVPLGEGHSK